MSRLKTEGSKTRLWLSYALAIAAMVSVAHYTGANAQDFLQAMAALLFALHLAMNAAAFAWVTGALRPGLPMVQLGMAWLASLAAKYIPGGVWHVVGRGVYLTRMGASVREVTAVGIFEQMHSLLLCSGIALSLFAWRLGYLQSSVWGIALPVLGTIAMLAVAPWFRVVVVHRAHALWGALVYGLAMLPYAGAYLLLCHPAYPARFVEALFAGTVVGVLAVPVPGGIGIRESVTAYLADSTSSSHLLAGLLAARLILFVLEVGATLTSQALWWRRRAQD
jgi:hypothetical protein